MEFGALLRTILLPWIIFEEYKLTGAGEIFPKFANVFLSGRTLCSILVSLSCYNCQAVALRGAGTCPQSQSKAIAGLGDTRGLLLLAQGSVLYPNSWSLGPCRKLGDKLAPSCTS